MFIFESQSDLEDDWFLGDREKNSGRISRNHINSITNYHLIGIQFLHENYIKKRGGGILNEDVEMNPILQVCTFLSSIKNEITELSPVLIVCTDDSLCKWHYHLNEVGFKPSIISDEAFQNSEIYLLTSQLINLWKQLSHLDFFSIVIDELESIAHKLIVKRMKSRFNIGIVRRNFYCNPDQKLKWSILNWIHPNCVGKLNYFYEIDRLHSLACSDNYRFWWFRLTWNFCDSFERPTDEELIEYQEKIKVWSESNGITIPSRKNVNKRKTTDKKDVLKKKRTIMKQTTNKESQLNNVEDGKSISYEDSRISDIAYMEIDDILNTLESPTKNDNNNINMDSEEDSAILSIISSKTDKVNRQNDLEKLSQSSDHSESDILSNIIINKSYVSSRQSVIKTKKIEQGNEESDFLSKLIDG